MRNVAASIICLTMLIAGCNTLTLKPSDFSWPVESLLKINDKGNVQDRLHSLTFNVKGLFFTEMQDSSAAKGTLHVIRNSEGYYFITAAKFKNVYIFGSTEGGLSLKNVIPVKTTGLESPALNQRSPYIQLINENDPDLMLTKDGVSEGAKK